MRKGVLPTSTPSKKRRRKNIYLYLKTIIVNPAIAMGSIAIQNCIKQNPCNVYVPHLICKPVQTAIPAAVDRTGPVEKDA